MRKTVFFAFALILSAVLNVRAAEYKIDAAHSSVSFKVRHLVIGKTRGHFSDFSGVVHYEPGKPKSWKAEAVIDVASIDTGNEKRDTHLRASDFLDVKKHPKIIFKSSGVKGLEDDSGVLLGELTIRGVTKKVALDVEINGLVKDHRGDERIGFTATTVINRFDYGISFSKKLDKGGLVVGEEVTITLEIEAIRKK